MVVVVVVVVIVVSGNACEGKKGGVAKWVAHRSLPLLPLRLSSFVRQSAAPSITSPFTTAK